MKIQYLRDGSIRNLHEIGGGGPMLPMPVDGSGHGSWPAWGGGGDGGQDGGGDGGQDGSIPPDVPTVWDDTNTDPVIGDGPPWHLWLLFLWALRNVKNRPRPGVLPLPSDMPPMPDPTRPIRPNW